MAVFKQGNNPSIVWGRLEPIFSFKKKRCETNDPQVIDLMSALGYERVDKNDIIPEQVKLSKAEQIIQRYLNGSDYSELANEMQRDRELKEAIEIDRIAIMKKEIADEVKREIERSKNRSKIVEIEQPKTKVRLNPKFRKVV